MSRLDVDDNNFSNVVDSQTNKPASFIPPENIKSFPKAQPRKGNQQHRQKRRSMIATDTPEKKALAISFRQGPPEKQSVPGPSRQGLLTAKRKILVESSSDEADEIMCSDHSSDKESLMGKNPEQFAGLERDPCVVEFVLVEFDTSPKTYYVGQITKEMDEEDELEVSYLRKKTKSNEFVFPEAIDAASVNINDIKIILTKSKMRTSTKRQNLSLKFEFNFDNIFIK